MIEGALGCGTSAARKHIDIETNIGIDTDLKIDMYMDRDLDLDEYMYRCRHIDKHKGVRPTWN